MCRIVAATIVAVAVLRGSASQFAPGEVRPPERLVVSLEERGQLGAAHLWELDLSAPDIPPRRLTAGAVMDQAPAVSPDGRWIAFSRARAEAPTQPRIWLRSTENSTERAITHDPSDHEPFWSRDGRTLSFTHQSHARPAGRSELMSVEPFDLQAIPRPLLPAAYPPQMTGSWHPRANVLLFTFTAPPGARFMPYEIWRRVATGEPERLIPGGCCGVNSPRYADDGNRVAYVSLGHSELGDVYVANADGSMHTRVTCVSGWAAPLWARSGDALLMRSRSHPGLWQVRVPKPGGSCAPSPVRVTAIPVRSFTWASAAR